MEDVVFREVVGNGRRGGGEEGASLVVVYSFTSLHSIFSIYLRGCVRAWMRLLIHYVDYYPFSMIPKPFQLPYRYALPLPPTAPILSLTLTLIQIRFLSSLNFSHEPQHFAVQPHEG